MEEITFHNLNLNLYLECGKERRISDYELIKLNSKKE